jgi:hypothetical protein
MLFYFDKLKYFQGLLLYDQAWEMKMFVIYLYNINKLTSPDPN